MRDFSFVLQQMNVGISGNSQQKNPTAVYVFLFFTDVGWLLWG